MAQWERQVSTGKWGGRKQGAKNKTEIEKFFKKLKETINVGNRKGLEQLAQPLVDEIATTMPGFNDYSENLANSYAATVFSKRKPVKTVFHETGSRGVPHTGPKGGRWVYLTKQRHGLPGTEIIDEPIYKAIQDEYHRVIGYEKTGKMKRTIRSGRNLRNPKKKRYLKKWERLGGYRKNTWGGRRYGMQIGYTPMTAGASRAQNWIVIENRAPYAEWVNRGVKNPWSRKRNTPRRVMKSAIARRIGPRVTELVRTVTLKELKAAGFTAK